MRHAIFAIPALLLACSSGGSGSYNPPSNSAFGGEDDETPALGGSNSTDVPALGGGTSTGGGAVDGGTQNDDTGTHPTDTGTVKVDSGSGGTGDDAICASKCPSDPVNEGLVSACKSALKATKCAAEGRAFWTCRDEKRVCDGEGMTDSSATAAACMAQQTAYSSCVGG